MNRWVRIGSGIVLVGLVGACAGAAPPPSLAPAQTSPIAAEASASAAATMPATAPSANAPTAAATPTKPSAAPATPRPSPLASATTTPSLATPVATRPASTRRPASSAKPRPSVDQAAVAEFLTATITFLDLADTDVGVGVTYLDTASGESVELGAYTLASSEQIAKGVPAGRYRLDFRLSSPGGGGPPCTIDVTDGAAWTFVAVPGAIAVNRHGFNPASAGDLFVASSPLCSR